MKVKKLGAFLLGMAIITSVTACGDTENSLGETSPSVSSGTDIASESASAPDQKLTIDVILKTLSAEYWQYVQAGAEAYEKEHPEVIVEVKGPTSETAYDEQMNMIQTDLASGKYDAMLISPLQSDSVAAQIKDATIPTLALDTNVESEDIVTFVGTGNQAAAKSGGIAAVEAAKKLGWDEVKCIEIAGVQGDETCAARMKGYQEGVEEAGGDFLEEEVQYANATADLAVAAMEGIMSKHPEGIAIIAAHNDDTAMAAAKAAKGNEAYKNTIFLGFNGDRSACEAMANGEYENYMSVAQNAFDMGYKGVEAAVQAIRGEALPDFVDSGSSIITKENAKERADALKSYIK